MKYQAIAFIVLALIGLSSWGQENTPTPTLFPTSTPWCDSARDDFEDNDISDWDVCYLGGVEISASVTDEDAHGGLYCVRLSPSMAGGSRGGIIKVFRVIPGNTYQLQFWFKTVSYLTDFGDGDLSNSAWNSCECPVDPNGWDVGSGWFLYATDSVVATGSVMCVYLGAQILPASDGPVFIDDVELLDVNNGTCTPTPTVTRTHTQTLTPTNTATQTPTPTITPTPFMGIMSILDEAGGMLYFGGKR